jgi:hypothetical protein
MPIAQFTLGDLAFQSQIKQDFDIGIHLAKTQLFGTGITLCP